MNAEIKFKKYESKGSNYHYVQINKTNYKTFNAFLYARYMKQVNIVKEYIKNRYCIGQNIKLLDVGCGDGVLLYLIKKKITQYNLELYGIDTSELALNTARKKIANVGFSKTDVYNLKFKSNYFDIIVSSDVIEHVIYVNKMISEIKRVAKKNAFIVIGTPIKCTKEPLDNMHYKEFYQDEFINLFSKHFNNGQLIESHSLLCKLIYEKSVCIFGRKKMIYRYIINLLSILFNINLFMRERSNKNELFSYMFIKCKK